MGLIGQPVALFDLGSCEAFAQRAIDKSQIAHSRFEHEELLAEGLTILYELAERYKPLPEPPCGYPSWFAMTLDDRQSYERELKASSQVKRGSFSGHCAMFFPRRLGDAWHKMHPEHRYITDPETGKRGWVYEQPMLSLNGLAAAGEGENSLDSRLLHARTINGFCHATRTATLALSRLASPRAA